MELALTADQVAAIEAIGRQHPGNFHEKFFANPQTWVAPKMLSRAIDMHLQRSPHKLWILDVGSAIPYFAHVCKKWEHDVISVDLPEDWLVQSAQALDCEYVPHRITLEQPLPRLPHRFDLVTMFGVNLNHANGSLFSFDEYMIVAKAGFDLLHPGGRLVVGFNWGYLDNVWQRIALWRRCFPAGTQVELKDNVVSIHSR
jgi:hypothetical protein